MRGIQLAAGLLALALGMTACGNDNASSGGSSSGSSGAPSAAKLKVGLAYDIGGRGDPPLHDSPARGAAKGQPAHRLDAPQHQAAPGRARGAEEGRPPP